MEKYCLCGCGGEVAKEKNRYIQYHAPAWNKGKTWDDHYGIERSKERKDRHKINYQKNFHSKESRIKAMANMPPIWNKGLTKNQMPSSMYSFERNAKVGRSGNQNGFKKGVPSWNKGLTKETSLSVAQASLHLKGKVRSFETIEKLKQSRLVMWQDPEYRKRMLPKICKVTYPNKGERYLLDILNQIYPNDWLFSGHGDVLVNGKKPDFTHKTKKLLIEMFGCYFHSCKVCGLTFKDHRESDKERIEFFKKFDYDCLILWEHELKDVETLKSKIINFVGEN